MAQAFVDGLQPGEVKELERKLDTDNLAQTLNENYKNFKKQLRRSGEEGHDIFPTNFTEQEKFTAFVTLTLLPLSLYGAGKGITYLNPKKLASLLARLAYSFGTLPAVKFALRLALRIGTLPLKYKGLFGSVLLAYSGYKNKQA